MWGILSRSRGFSLWGFSRPVVQRLDPFQPVEHMAPGVVLGETDWVMEINPRLTTSYLGLRALAEANLGEMMVRIVRGEESGPPRWRPGVVHFSPLAISSKPTDDRPWA